ncbi:MAG: peroxiredoxin [Proteobacteria bacterium]|nr:peroxiredoxin [Pseudomonadota bacterium]
MSIQAGEKMPSGTFGVMTESGPGAMSTDDLFADKKVVIFSVPGAFTPTCSMNHLPGFIDHAEKIIAKGVNTIACMAVNDVFVMDAWGRDRGVGEHVTMLADGNGEYAKALGLDFDASAFGMGTRAQRFALIVDNGIVLHVAVEKAGQFEVSSAESILENL